MKTRMSKEAGHMTKDIDSIFFDITPKIEELALKCEKNNEIDKELYTKYEVKRGLRDLNGKGVLAGLTNICLLYTSTQPVFRLCFHGKRSMGFPYCHT